MKIDITSWADVYIAEFRAQKLLKDRGIKKESLPLVVKELATNILKYGGKGKIEIRATLNDITIVAENEVKKERSSGLGIGLEVVKRNVDHLEVKKTKGSIRVEAKILFQKNRFKIEYGFASKCHYLETVAGDIFKIKTFADRYLIVTADVLGHGQKANREAKLIEKYVEDFNALDLKDFYYGLEKMLLNKRGCVAFFGFLFPDKIEFGLMGNIRVWIVSSKAKKRLVGQQGIVGRITVSLKIFTEPLFQKEDTFLIICTDGIKKSFDPQDTPFIFSFKPQIASEKILNRYALKEDDALVAVVKKIRSS